MTQKFSANKLKPKKYIKIVNFFILFLQLAIILMLPPCNSKFYIEAKARWPSK